MLFYVMLCYVVILFYVMLCHIISYAIIWLCHVVKSYLWFDDLWCINLHISCHVNYIKYERYEKICICMFHWFMNGRWLASQTYAMILNYEDLMHLCMPHVSGYFSVIISMDAYPTIFMLAMILCGSFPMWHTIVWACTSPTS